jgi:lysophospholipase L1-like esterase
MARSKILALKILVPILSLAIVILALEAWLAIAQINTKSFDRYVPGKGITYLPGAYYRHTKEGFSEGYINSHGFRDYERTYNKPANSFRILILGDSYVEALQVSLENAFPALLEKKLNKSSTETTFEVLNLGQSGFGTADAYMRYLNFGIHYSPDLVLLAFLTGNDIRDNSKFLSQGSLAYYFAYDEKGRLQLDQSLFKEYDEGQTFSRQVFQYIKRRSYLASLISERLYLLKLELRERSFADHSAELGQSGSERGVDVFSALNIYLSNPGDRWNEAFAVTQGLLRRFRDDVERNGSQFVLVTLSNAEQIHPEVQAKLRKDYGVTFDFERPDRIIAEFAAKEHITHLELMPLFRDHHLRTGKYLHGFGGSTGGHWNENGHRLAAEKIFKFLTEKHLLSSEHSEAVTKNQILDETAKAVQLSRTGLQTLIPLMRSERRA